MCKDKLVVCLLMTIALTLWGETYAEIVTVPAGLNPGDPYRLVFVTAGTRDSTALDIATYNAFVDSEAGLLSQDGNTDLTWKAIASTPSTDARDNTGTANLSDATPIYDLQGLLVAAGNADLWDGYINSPIKYTQNGTIIVDEILTGSFADGTGQVGNELGSGRPRYGCNNNPNLNAWIFCSLTFPSYSKHFYAMSEVLITPPVIPEPSSLILLGAGMAGIAAVQWRKRRRPQRHQ